MTTKRAALADLVRLALVQHDGRFRVAEHLDESLLDASATERDQKRVMGDPVRYAEVLYAGDAEPLPGTTNVRGRATETREVFEVNVWWEISRRARAADQAAWEAAWKGSPEYGPEGLVTRLHRLVTLPLPGISYAVLASPPEEAATFATQIRTGTMAHYGRLLITLT